MASEFLLANPVIRVSADTAGALRQIQGMERQAGASLKRLGQRMDAAGQRMGNIGRSITLATVPMIGALGVAIKKSAEFEQSLAEMSAIGGLTEAQIGRISEKALQLGKDTKFTATDALAAFQDMVKDGRQVEQMMGSIDAVFAGAAASGESLGQTQVFLSDTMDIFGIATEKSRDAMQTMMAAAVTSPATFAEIARSLRNAGVSAATLGIPLEDVNAALVVLAKQGQRGQEAGTKLRQFFDYLTPATDKAATAMAAIGVDAFDSTGKFIGLSNVVGQFREGLSDLSQEQQTLVLGDIFGIRARQAAQLLINYEMTLDEVIEKMGEAADIEEIAAEQMDTFSGSVANLRSSIETLMIRVGQPLADALRPVIDNFLIPFVDNMSDFAADHPEIVTGVAAMTAAVAGLGISLIAAGFAMKLMAPAIATLGGILSGGSLAFAGLVALPAALAGSVLAYQESETFREFVDGIVENINTFIEETDFSLSGEIFAMRLARSISTAFSGDGAAGGIFGGIPQRIKDLIFGFEKTTTQPFTDFATGQASDFFAATWVKPTNLFDGYYDSLLEGLAAEMQVASTETTITLTEKIPGLATFANTLAETVTGSVKGAIEFTGGFWPIFKSALGQMIPDAETLGLEVGEGAKSVAIWLEGVVKDAVDGAVTFIQKPAEEEGSALYLIKEIGTAIVSAVSGFASYGGEFISGFLTAFGFGGSGGGLGQQIMEALFGAPDVMFGDTVVMAGRAGLFETLAAMLRRPFVSFATWLKTNWIAIVKTAFLSSFTAIADLVRDEDGELKILDSLKAPFNKFKTWVSDLWPGSPKVTDVIRDSYTKGSGIIPTIETLDELVQNPLKAPFMGFKTWLGKQKFEAPEIEMTQEVSSPFQDLAIWDEHLKSPFESLVSSVENFLNLEDGGLLGALKQPFLTLGDWITTLWDNHLKAPFETLKDSITGFFSSEGAGGGILDWITEGIGGLSAAIFGEASGTTGGKSRLRAGQRAGGTALRLQSDLATLPQNIGKLLKDILRLDWDKFKGSSSLVGKQAGRAGLRGITGILAAEGDESIPEAIMSSIIATRMATSGAQAAPGLLGGVGSKVSNIFTPLTDEIVRIVSGLGTTTGTSAASSWWRSLLGSFDDFFRAGKVGPALLKGAATGAGMLSGPVGFLGGFLAGDVLVDAAFDEEFRTRVKNAAIAIKDAFIQESQHLDEAGAEGGVGGLLDAILIINEDDVDYEALTASIGAIFDRLGEIVGEKVENISNLIFGEEIGTTERSLAEIVGGTFLTALNLAKGTIYAGISLLFTGAWNYLSGEFWSFDTSKVGSLGWIVSNTAVLTGTILTVLLAEAKNIITLAVAPIIETIGSSIRDRIVRSFIGETVTVGDHLTEGFTESLAAGTTEMRDRRQGLFWAGLGDLFAGGIEYLDQQLLQPVRDWGTSIGPKIQEALAPFGQAARNVFRAIFQYPLILLSGLPVAIVGILTGASPAMAKGAEALAGAGGAIMAEGIGDAMTGTAGGQSVTGAIEESGKTILDALKQPFLDFGDYLGGLWDDVKEHFEALWQGIDYTLIQPIRNAFENVVVWFKNLAADFATTLADLIEGVPGPIRGLIFVGASDELIAGLRALSDSIRGGVSGVSGGGASGVSGGGASGATVGMARGGMVQAGRPYMVGELGPELFLPRASGRIVPNHQLAGAGGMTINITVNNAQNMNADQLARRVRHEVEGALFREQDRRY